MFHKVLVANRGERLQCLHRTGRPERRRFPHEDRKSEHVLNADEAYDLGTAGHPVRNYLDPAEITRVVVEAEADAIYPGYTNGQVGDPRRLAGTVPCEGSSGPQYPRASQQAQL